MVSNQVSRKRAKKICSEKDLHENKWRVEG